MALSISLFEEAISLLAVCQRVIDANSVLKCYENKQAVLASAKDYSPKLKHLAKFRRINVASTCEAFSAEDILTSHQKADVMNMWSGALELLCIKPMVVT